MTNSTTNTLLFSGLSLLQQLVTANTPFSTPKINAHVAKNWFAKGQYYTVAIHGGGSFPDSKPDMMMNCDAISIPGISLSVMSEKRSGIGLQSHYPNGKSYTECSMNFYESEFEAERQYFTNWINAIYNPVTMKYGFFNDYSKTVVISTYNRKGQVVYTCTLNNAWVTNIGQIDRGYSHDGVMTFPVSLQFYDMTETFYSSTGISGTQAIQAALNLGSSIIGGGTGTKAAFSGLSILNQSASPIQQPTAQPQGQIPTTNTPITWS